MAVTLPELLYKTDTRGLTYLRAKQHLVAIPTMLDDFSIVTTSGIVLWRRSYAPVSTNVVNSLINDVFVEERQKAGAQENAVNPPYRKDKYTLKWTVAKDMGLVFVVGKSAGAICSPSPEVDL